MKWRLCFWFVGYMFNIKLCLCDNVTLSIEKQMHRNNLIIGERSAIIQIDDDLIWKREIHRRYETL